MPELVVQDLHKRYKGQVALGGISFTVKDGEFFTLLGPSGCGKSTTLMSIAGLETPNEGVITVGDTTFVDRARGIFTPPEERDLGVVFQSYALWPHMTVKQNLELPLKLRKVPRHKREEMISSALEQVGLDEHMSRYPHQLSGGQQQRVALARALAYSPRVLLLDEPLSNLDAKLRERARAWLKDLQRDVGITTIYVTHDQTEALSLSDRVAVMQKGEMLQVGTPEEIYEQPARREVAEFVGRCNTFSGKVVDAARSTVEVELDSPRVRLTADTTTAVGVGARVTVGVRVERVGLTETRPRDATGAVIEGRVVTRSYTGARYEYELKVDGADVFVESDDLVPEGPAYMVFPRQGTFVFADSASPLPTEEELAS